MFPVNHVYNMSPDHGVIHHGFNVHPMNVPIANPLPYIGSVQQISYGPMVYHHQGNGVYIKAPAFSAVVVSKCPPGHMGMPNFTSNHL